MKAIAKNKFFLCVGLFLLVMGFIAIGLVWQQRKGGEGIYHGLYTDSFETSRFEPCGGNERWWAKGNTTPIYQAFYPDFKKKGLPVSGGKLGYVELRGKVSGRGSYGHLGEYDREIEVQKVLRVQLTIPDSCK